MSISSFRELKVWQKSMDLVELTYKEIRKLPQEERFELKSQMQRCAVSIPSNIAEGYARSSTKEYLNFLSIAKGSAAELLTQLLLCVRLGYRSDDDVAGAIALLTEVDKMLTAMTASLKNKGN